MYPLFLQSTNFYFFFFVIGDQIQFDNADNCKAYVSASSQVTVGAMQDESTGVPKIGYAMIMSLYSTSVPLHLSKNTTYMSQTRPANWSHTLGCVSPLTCTKQLGKFARGNLTGWDIQNCAIAVGLECGEDALEMSGTLSCFFNISLFIC